MSDKIATVLIVDDQPANIHALASLLKKDYRILTAIHAEKAWEIVRRSTVPDLILLDILMPGMDGYELCRRLKNHEATKTIPIIFVTALGEERDEAYGLDLGAVDYITKPFSPAIVRARVRNHISLKLKTDMLEQVALQDGLTQIPNRRCFDQRLRKEWARLTRNGQPLALLMIDIDHFKAYNDHYGHGAGDECLQRVAHAIHQVPKRPIDLVARYGGEEFAALLPETDEEGASHLAGQMLSAVQALGIRHAYSEVAPQVTISIGLAVHSTAYPKGSAEELKNAADQSLYQAKARGRNRLVCEEEADCAGG
ncbi:diguanylate cyclase [Caldichromatium japonicum]|uniref:diguanylate cyclase n=1 Tax=Caldichromatium japonicum TaxID=2699430 RepID=A0A6G7VEQ5_9GAMM|nr:diguanylate cyclase [Caldichromatium japonicum]QIK38454.1 diguanylate cyclase [Caldichromatium japonicum]